jgi:hypothetical protein
MVANEGRGVIRLPATLGLGTPLSQKSPERLGGELERRGAAATAGLVTLADSGAMSNSSTAPTPGRRPSWVPIPLAIHGDPENANHRAPRRVIEIGNIPSALGVLRFWSS